MRAVIQRVTKARVNVADEVVGAIGRGFLIFIGVGVADTEQDSLYLADKTVNLRVFEDTEGKMNRSIADEGGEILVVSQFTLWGDCRKGRRPSFTQAAPPERGEALYEHFCTELRNRGMQIQQGRFRADMQVELVNDGPVTMLLDSQRLF
ncbi:MAG TPA: D-aminoacyl-tRNA deacylase [Bacillota bacterium]|nr:D-aminoacyl-tRNA deacylase [Bacillota bacterium]